MRYAVRCARGFAWRTHFFHAFPFPVVISNSIILLYLLLSVVSAVLFLVVVLSTCVCLNFSSCNNNDSVFNNNISRFILDLDVGCYNWYQSRSIQIVPEFISITIRIPVFVWISNICSRCHVTLSLANLT